jgi:tRNA (guanine37-N1)-methyltransferase
MQIEVVTLLPALLHAALPHGVLGRALSQERVRVGCVDPREFASDAHRTVDDRPYGGGPGMVGKPDVWAQAIAAARARVAPGAPRVYLTAQGAPLTDSMARSWATLPGLVLVAGRYEGLDERVIEASIDIEVSIGDYVLSGGEYAALVVIDTVARLLPGVLGDERSANEDSFASGLLDWPHYTRPVSWQGRDVPAVLQSGDHAAIARWRQAAAIARTQARRPDLMQQFLSKQQLKDRQEDEHG